MVRTSPPMQGVNSIPGQETKILHAWGSKKKNIKRNRSNIVISSIKALKMGHIKKSFLKILLNGYHLTIWLDKLKLFITFANPLTNDPVLTSK